MTKKMYKMDAKVKEHWEYNFERVKLYKKTLNSSVLDTITIYSSNCEWCKKYFYI